MSAEENEPVIKVVDRRRFVQEGDEIRENLDAAPSEVKPAGAPPVEPPPPQPEAAAAAQAGPTAPPPGPQAGTQAGTQPASEPPKADTEQSRKEAAQRRAEQAAAGLPPADITTLIEFLAQQVSMYLGEPDPTGRAMQPNYPLAGLFIDLLGTLQEKTKGNLSLEESQILDQLLYTLRIHYVQRRR